MREYIKKLFLFAVLIFCSLSVFAENTSVIYIIDIKQEIDRTSQLYLLKGIKEAKEMQADAILLHMNTYGGLVDAADSMRTAILYCDIPVSVFIDNNAASAGALISIACDKIFMRRGANIGAATVVNQTGSAMPDKYQSYMRSTMRSTAESHGRDTIIQGNDTIIKWKRDPLIAEAMVDERVVIPGLVDGEHVLTFTAEEAVKWGYCDGIEENIDDVIKALGYNDYKKVKFTASWVDSLKGFLMSPILQSILILIIIGGIYFELQTPGVGFPSIAAITAGILYFAPLYIEGLAENWEILLFIIGVLLLAVEIFVIPGFGVAGITGIILMVAGLILSLLANVTFDFEGVSAPDVTEATLTVMVGMVLSFVIMIWLTHRIGRKGLFHKVALNTDLEDAISVPVFHDMAGKEGVAATVLRPSGTVSIDGELFDAVSEGGFIEKGARIKVRRYENAQVYVYEIPASAVKNE
ncbi:MAG: ATP-dependent Clp protease proteolytic subunit [Tannerellaceae bacterium]|nr:ATP-dependent Clp protease proteolytic subunit [Tannerellaceae bacterium]